MCLVATATVLELAPMASSQTATSCLCTACYASGRSGASVCRAFGEVLAPLELGPGGLLEVHLADLDLARAGVRVGRHPGLGHRTVDERQRDRDCAVVEEALAGAERHGEDPHSELVDQVVPEQGLDEAGAAVDLEFRPLLALQRLDVVGDVARDQG